MYAKDIFDVAVNWAGTDILPSGAKSIDDIDIKGYDGGLLDVSASIISEYGIDGLVSFATTKNVTQGTTYTFRHRVTFDNGEIRDKFLTVEVVNPRSETLKEIPKFPNDQIIIPVPWNGRLPRAAKALGNITVKAYDDNDVDVSSTYIEWAQTKGMFSVAKVKGGTGGESRLIEFGQSFDNGRKFHAYATLKIKTPVV